MHESSMDGTPTLFSHRSQTYIIPSRSPNSVSTCRVEPLGPTVTVEEQKFGLVYTALSCVAGYAILIWQLRRRHHDAAGKAALGD